MGLNTLIEDLQNKLIDDINNSQLPVGIIYYIAKDVFSQIETEYQKSLTLEKQQEEDSNKENNKNDDSDKESEN